MQQLNPQAIIDELARRLQQVTLENVVLTSQLAEIQNQLSDDETVIIGGDIPEE
jgi:hypothetical protein